MVWLRRGTPRPPRTRGLWPARAVPRTDQGNRRRRGNPGCYPTSVALGLAPALRGGFVEPTGIVVDAKSGTTGAGRKTTQGTHFPECNEAFSAYKVANHRHTPEIEQTLTLVGGEKATVTFVPHLLPVNRGILSTIYAKLKPGASLAAVRAVYEKAYTNEKFVRLLPEGTGVDIRNIQCSNYCDIQLYADEPHGPADCHCGHRQHGQGRRWSGHPKHEPPLRH